MRSVWAYRTENLGTSFKVAGEWDLVVKFDSLDDLVGEFQKAKLDSGQVGKLAIVAHGDKPGIVQLKPTHLTGSTAAQYASTFAVLRDYLSTNARVIFYSCIAGARAEGSELLNELSGKYFKNRHVIGFERLGVASGTANDPAGTVWCQTRGLRPDPKFYCDPTATLKPVTDRRAQKEQILNEYSIYAKWSYNGTIIKVPLDEVSVQTYSIPEVRCGPEAVTKAVKDPVEREKIDYIAINTTSPSNSLIDLFSRLQGPPYKIRWSTLRDSNQQRLIEYSEQDAKLVHHHKGRLRPHEEIVAVFKKQLTQRYKCASPLCPTHAHYKDYCTDALEHILNGPLT